ncbi:multidrug efflux system outer membrane protein [Paucibacter oligotrophus]|uniref:Multidrug efflux system outer membrane protein n=1 Tax=Roseateles oligotrophus TaxID=1769250 RepID=A0A840LE28_9BURK|nr:efflux transporter outer membrane subunit [Roseateles oligotrophus]MBB4844319.1 multidrug efflux system outer membrane protein [Roseateles oligotrophus]
MMPARLSLLAAALLLAACAGPQPATLQEAAELPALPSHWLAPARTDGNLAEQRHADLFKDAELEQLIQEGLRNNRELRTAARRVQLAQAQLGLQDSARWPHLGLGAGGTRQRAPSGLSASENTTSTVYNTGLALPAWEIDLWGRLGDLSAAAQLSVEASAALRQFVQVGLISRITAGWLTLLEIDQSLAISTRTEQSRADSLRIMNLRFKAGVVSMVDVSQAETSLAQAQAAKAQLLQRRGLQENALSLLVGRNPGPIRPSRGLASFTLPEALPAGLPSDLLLRRPDVRAAEMSVAASRASVSAARKAYLPSISLSGFLGFVSPQLSALLQSERSAYTVSPSLSLPLFTGGALQSGLAVAEAQQGLALEDYARTAQTALREVEDALLSFQQLRQQGLAMERIVAASRERLRLVELRYKNGISSYFEVLDSQRQLFDAELQQAQLSSGTYASVIELYRALGGGWEAAPKS